MSSCCKLFLYLKLIYNVKKYYGYVESGIYNEMLLNDILIDVNKCGAVMIKFTQWICPKLELIYSDNNKIINNEKPDWLVKMERFYENCDNHPIEYTKKEYKRTFNQDPDEIYEFNEIIGSGSIGQVYLVTNKETGKEEVIKILHPDVSDDINLFDKFLRFMLYFPCINNKVKNIFPFDIFEFIDQFKSQTDFINEANHMIYFSDVYKDNDFIVIPELKKISPSILVMSYEPGISFHKSELNEYQNDKIANLYHLFIRENQIIKNYNHGDLHPGNWKIRKSADSIVPVNMYKLIIYDFGYCWRIPHKTFNDIGTIFIDTFEESNRENREVSVDNLCKLIYFSVLYNKPDKETIYKNRIKEFVNNKIDILEPWKLSPVVLLRSTIEFCKIEGLLLDPVLLQCFIIVIQGQKIFEKYGLMASDNNMISDYKVFRERYLDILTFCKTYDIFHGFSEYIENKLNEKQVQVSGIFDTIDINDIDLRNMALDI